MNQDNENHRIEFYRHQVGGHHCIIAHKGYILKPYNENEASMYYLIPHKYPHLVPFLSEFHGIVCFLDSEMGLFPTDAGPFLEIARTLRIAHSESTCVIDQREEWLKTLFLKRFNREEKSNL